MSLSLSEAERSRLVDLVNELHDAVQAYDDWHVADEPAEADDALRNAADVIGQFH